MLFTIIFVYCLVRSNLERLCRHNKVSDARERGVSEIFLWGSWGMAWRGSLGFLLGYWFGAEGWVLSFYGELLTSLHRKTVVGLTLTGLVLFALWCYKEMTWVHQRKYGAYQLELRATGSWYPMMDMRVSTLANSCFYGLLLFGPYSPVRSELHTLLATRGVLPTFLLVSSLLCSLLIPVGLVL